MNKKKVTLIVSVLVTMLLASTSYASDMEKFFRNVRNIDDNFFIESCGEECLQIETRGGAIFKIMACGQVLKQDWRELNKNEEPTLGSVITFTGDTTLSAEAINLEYATGCWDILRDAPCE